MHEASQCSELEGAPLAKMSPKAMKRSPVFKMRAGLLLPGLMLGREKASRVVQVGSDPQVLQCVLLTLHRSSRAHHLQAFASSFIRSQRCCGFDKSAPGRVATMIASSQQHRELSDRRSPLEI